MNKTIALALHGGAGEKEHLSDSEEQEYLQALEKAVDTGYDILHREGTALDAVEAAVRCMEDNPLFNSGRGSAMDFYGRHTMEAAMMCGSTCKAGAVARLHGIRNPIVLAHCILKTHDYVMLSGEEAIEFAVRYGLKCEPEEYFLTQKQFEKWLEAQSKERSNAIEYTKKKKSFGTVGAVALDANGNLAAGTSTGGLVNSRYGRIGDSCVIGAGVYADSHTCAVSCTGTGEHIIRSALAHEVSSLMEHTRCSLSEAAKRAIDEKIRKGGGEAGLVAIDSEGNIDMPFSAERMYRAYRKNDEKVYTALY